MNRPSRLTAARTHLPGPPVGIRPPRAATALPKQNSLPVPAADPRELRGAMGSRRTTVPRLRPYDAAATAASGHQAMGERRSSRRTDPIIQSLRAAAAASAIGKPLPAPDFDALSEALSEAADQHLRSLNGRAAAHWLFAATIDLAKRLTSRDLMGAAAALESAHLALRFAHTRASEAPALWRALADIACALQA